MACRRTCLVSPRVLTKTVRQNIPFHFELLPLAELGTEVVCVVWQQSLQGMISLQNTTQIHTLPQVNGFWWVNVNLGTTTRFFVSVNVQPPAQNLQIIHQNNLRRYHSETTRSIVKVMQMGSEIFVMLETKLWKKKNKPYRFYEQA